MGRFTEVASDDAPAAVAVTESFVGSFVDIADACFKAFKISDLQHVLSLPSLLLVTLLMLQSLDSTPSFFTRPP